MWESIELREIRLFLTLAEELHFGRTAERLGLTTSRVSQSLRLLERKLGEPLVFRTSRQVVLTAFGERFLAEAGAAYERLGEALERSYNANKTIAGVLRFGVFEPCAGGPHLVEIAKTFEAKYPSSNVQVIQVPKEPVETLRKGEIDILAIRQPLAAPGLVVGPTLARDRRVLAVAEDHPLAARAELSIEDAADHMVTECVDVPESIMREYIPEYTPGGKVIRRIDVSPVRPFELVSLIVRGKVVHPTVPGFADHFPMAGIKLIPITDMRPLNSTLVWQKATGGPRVQAFVQNATEVLDEKSKATG